LRVAESYSEIVARGNAAMAQVIKDVNDKKAKNVLIVSSGGMIPTLLDLVLTERYQRKLIANCGVTILKLKNNLFSLDVIGDTRYTQ
ncbi:MAG: histidine phosphatase family protein, partial [Enterococcus sp.]